MKKIICLLVLLALTPGVHAGDKKKKNPNAGAAPVRAPGGGAKSGGGFPGMSRGAGPTGARQSAPRTRTAPSLGSRGPSAGKAPKSISQPTGHGATAGRSTNPLMRKSSQAGANQRGANPLMKGNRQAGANKANPLAKRNGAQPGMNNRNPNALANRNPRNNANLGRNRGTLAQTGRGMNKRAGMGAWQRGSHANYRVRPYREVFRNYHPYRHDRIWYSSHYDRVVVVGGGYYYWDGGYWYPAWGYDPAVAFYAYDGPIYSYDNLPPDQVTMNVQTALQDEGYYTGEIDGLVGPKTRDALGAYQTDHNLEVTAAVDEPTVEALGLAQST